MWLICLIYEGLSLLFLLSINIIGVCVLWMLVFFVVDILLFGCCSIVIGMDMLEFNLILFNILMEFLFVDLLFIMIIFVGSVVWLYKEWIVLRIIEFWLKLVIIVFIFLLI